MSEGMDKPGRRLGRRRRANVTGGRMMRHEVKVSPEEEARLLQLAERHHITIPRLLVESALAGQGETPTERKAAIAELFALHRLVATIANNVNQLARVANVTGEVPGEYAFTLQKVREVADRISGAIDDLAAGR